MRARLVIVYLLAACGGGDGQGPAADCSPACGGGLVCRYQACVAPPAACADAASCAGDSYCDLPAMECLPWGVGPGGASDATCRAAVTPGVFRPVTQCEWAGPPAGDAFPQHANVLATPMVAALEAGAAPVIVFPSYNFTDHQSESCVGSNPEYFGVLRVIDGRSCAQLATIAAPSVIATAPVALADLDADGAPEIIAARSRGGLVAFTRSSSAPGGWRVLWETASVFADQLCNWAGPSIHDLDDDGGPEVVFHGAVYDGRTGATLDEAIAGNVDSVGVGYIPVVADVDADGAPELVTGSQLYGWDRRAARWTAKRGLPGANGAVAVGDFGTFPAAGQDDRSRTDGIAEIVLVYQGVARVFTAAGREVFAASLEGVAGAAGQGGPPVVADFDGDGRAEIGTAGQTAYNVLDPDCGRAPEAATCASLATDGVLWVAASRGSVPNLTGSSAFDFDGDGRAEAVYADECFTRVYDGTTGAVLASRARTSCTWYENPVVVDADGDFNAELITTSNRNCSFSCPAIDPLFDGVACVADGDCGGAMRCGRAQAGDALGRCRCTLDDDCGDGFACRDPIAGPSAAGKVCRAAHGPAASGGVRVLADATDRWAGARPIWNQHAYSVTHVDAQGRVPRTSQWLRNWAQAGLNNFRENASSAPAASPDLTVRRADVACAASAPVVHAEVCNRGGEPVAPGIAVAVYAATTPSRLRCQAQTAGVLAPGACETVSCAWIGSPGDGAVVIDDRGDGGGDARECREDNNALDVRVVCPPTSL